jgi:ribosome-dependent ATPase
VVIALISFISLLLLSVFLFGVPVTGSFAALLAGVLVYVCAATGFGLLISCFTNTQVAAIFAASVLTITPCANFSGLLVPVSALSGPAQAISYGYPAGWFMQISLGAFTKRLGFADLWPDLAVIAGFAILFVVVAVAVLPKQEA